MTYRDIITRDIERGLSDRAIAQKVGCHPSYVRTVKQRNLRGRRSPGDEKWLSKQRVNTAVRKFKALSNAEQKEFFRAICKPMGARI
jgi:AraC-like DNA-binding protein